MYTKTYYIIHINTLKLIGIFHFSRENCSKSEKNRSLNDAPCPVDRAISMHFSFRFATHFRFYA